MDQKLKNMYYPWYYQKKKKNRKSCFVFKDLMVPFL